MIPDKDDPIMREIHSYNHQKVEGFSNNIPIIKYIT